MRKRALMFHEPTLRALRGTGRAAVVAIASVCFAASGGCVARQTVREIAFDTTNGYYDAVAKVDPEVQHKVTEAILRDPGVASATHDVAQAAVRGIIDGFSATDWGPQAASASSTAAENFRREGLRTLNAWSTEIGVRIQRGIEESTSRAIAVASIALRENAERDLSAAVHQLTQVLARSLIETTFQTTRDNRDMIEQSIVPVVGQVARTAAYEVVTGMQNGMRDANYREPGNELMKSLGSGLGEGLTVGIRRGMGDVHPVGAVMLVGLGALLAVVVFGIVKLVLRLRPNGYCRSKEH